MRKIPVVILNGFLGSGKTTLFRNLLSQSQKNNLSICAIVNDMSELDIDGELIANTEIVEEDQKIMESISSDVLSSKNGIKKLDKSINNLLSKNTPEIIFIETSGSCHPMPLIRYFRKHKKIYLTGVLVLVDSLMLTHDYNEGKSLIPMLQEKMMRGKRGTINLLIEQILFANHVIITKSDRISISAKESIYRSIQQINPYSSVNSIVYGKLSLESILNIQEYNYYNVEKLFQELQPALEAEENDNKPYNLATRVIKDDRPFHPQRLWDVCHNYLDKRIYRSKGFFWLASRDSQSLLWNQAAGGINLEIMGTWRVAILRDKHNGLLKEELTLLEEKIKKEGGRFGDRCCDLTIIANKNQINKFTQKITDCFLTESEIKKWENGEIFKDPWPKNIVNLKENK